MPVEGLKAIKSKSYQLVEMTLRRQDHRPLGLGLVQMASFAQGHIVKITALAYCLFLKVGETARNLVAGRFRAVSDSAVKPGHIYGREIKSPSSSSALS